ncbi:type IV pilin N-terminal domain-containing protein [Natrialbaceae archaeon A-arb3/5]
MSASNSSRSNEGRSVDSRGISPLVGTVALLVVTVCLIAVLAAGVTAWSIEQPAPTATFDLSVDSDNSRVAIDHRAGDAIDVRELSLSIAVDGTDLSSQPPVPFVGAEGFNGTPNGPFNAKADSTWRSGEQASVDLAADNEPSIESGEPVSVALAVDGNQIAALETTAE